MCNTIAMVAHLTNSADYIPQLACMAESHVERFNISEKQCIVHSGCVL